MNKGHQVQEASAEYIVIHSTTNVRHADTSGNALPRGYKKTEIGVIPEDWEFPKLGKICTLINGRGFKPHEWSQNGLPIIRIQNLNGSDDFNYYDGLYDSKIFVKHSQLLFAWSGSRGTSFGPHIWNRGDALLNYHTWKLITDSSQVDDKYFFYALKALTKSIEDSAHGASALVHTQKGEMEQFFVPLPPTKQEQAAIANALSDVDALIAALEKLITKKSAIKTAAMQQLLTGKKRLPPFDQLPHSAKSTRPTYKQTELGEIPEDWEVKPLGNVLKIRHGKSQKEIESISGKYPILATGGEIGRTSTFLYDKPSVLIGRKGTINQPRYMDTPFWTVDTLFFSEIEKNVSPKFVFYKFCLIDWMAYNEASGVPSLNASTIEAICESFPAKIEEQTAIAKVLSDMDQELQALQQRLHKTQQIKQGMMQELLTGKTRLV